MTTAQSSYVYLHNEICFNQIKVKIILKFKSYTLSTVNSLFNSVILLFCIKWQEHKIVNTKH